MYFRCVAIWPVESVYYGLLGTNYKCPDHVLVSYVYVYYYYDKTSFGTITIR